MFTNVHQCKGASHVHNYRHSEPAKACGVMKAEMAEIVTNCVPIMLLLCNQGVKQRHLDTISELTGVGVIPGEGTPTQTRPAIEIVARKKTHGLRYKRT